MRTEKLPKKFFEQYKRNCLLKKLNNFFLLEKEDKYIEFGILYVYFLEFTTPLDFIDKDEDMPMFGDLSESDQEKVAHLNVHANTIYEYLKIDPTVQTYHNHATIVNKDGIKKIIELLKIDWIKFTEILDDLDR